jgi:CBS domain-containing protein
MADVTVGSLAPAMRCRKFRFHLLVFQISVAKALAVGHHRTDFPEDFGMDVEHSLGHCIAESHLNGRGSLASGGRPRQRPGPFSRSQVAAMLISDVLRTKGHNVVRIHPADSIELAVQKLAEHRIGALVVEDRWMKPVGIFSERDFINAVARNGAAVLGFQVQQLMSTPIVTCRSSDRVDAVLATMTTARIRHLPVIEDNALKGIVSIGDLVKHRLDEKELEASVLLDISRRHA